MSTAAAPATAPTCDLTDTEFNALRRLVRRATGINLSEAKRDLIYSRLLPRLRSLRLSSFTQYLDLLGSTDGVEMTDCVNAVTANITSFFREPHHFEYLAATALPTLARARVRERRLRIWSAGCSTGEEAYSIAMVLRETAARFGGWDTRILATDIDTAVLATASAGVYSRKRLQGMSAARAYRWFRSVGASADERAAVVDELRQLVVFRRLNLLEAWPFQGRFDVIFARNMFTYFDADTRETLFERYADALNEGGLLFLGQAETLNRVTGRFALIGRTIYRKL